MFLWPATCGIAQASATAPARPPEVNFLTNFADQAVTLPLAACVFVILLALGWRRGALAWGACVAGVLAVMLVLKLVTLACGAHFAWTGLVSPSGHTATAAVVYGGLFALLARGARRVTPVAACAGGVMALGTGLTRLALHVHTVADVVAGAAVGVMGAVLMAHLAGPRPSRLGAPWLLAGACLVLLVFHGDRLEAESRLHWLAFDVWPLSGCR